MTIEEAHNILLKLRAWRAWGHSEQNGANRLELPSQKEIDQALDVFIEVLSQHSLPEDLEEAAEKYKSQWDIEHPHSPDIDFIVGAKWDREQMMEKAVETQILTTSFINLPKEYLHRNGIQAGNKVRVIVIKKE